MSDVWRNDKAIQELKVEVKVIQELKVEVKILKQAVSNIEKFLEVWDYKEETTVNSKPKKERNDVLQHNETTRKESHQS